MSQIASATAPLHDPGLALHRQLVRRTWSTWPRSRPSSRCCWPSTPRTSGCCTRSAGTARCPRALGRTHPRHKTPHIAIIVYSVFTLVIGLAAGIGWGPLAAFGDLGYLSSLAILPVYIGANVALPFFIYRRYRSEFSVVVHVIFPAVSSAIFLLAIWLSIHPYPATAPTNLFPPLLAAFIVGAIITAVVLRRRGSPVLARLGSVLFMEAQAMPEAQDVAGTPTGPESTLGAGG